MFRNFIFLFCCCIIFACSTKTEQKKSKKQNHHKVIVPVFNTDSAYSFIEKQVGFGPRALSSKGWENCAIWLEHKLNSYTSNVIVQEAPIITYDGVNHTLKNIIASS